jgi:predicted transposase YbfD/YdcC
MKQYNSTLKIGMVLVAVIILITMAATSCKNSVEEYNKKNNVTRTHSGSRVYEIEHKGATYLVIETHNGIGICPKVNQ